MNWRQMGMVIISVSVIGFLVIGFVPTSEECKHLSCKTKPNQDGVYTVIYYEKPLLIILVDKLFNLDLPIKYRYYVREYRIDN